jgi:transposase InsO family protein
MVKMGVKMNDGSCVRLRPRYRGHVWSYDFVHHRTDDGRVFRTLNILDEFSGECLEIRVKRKLNATDVVNALTDLFILRGIPTYIRSDNGPEFVAKTVRDWIHAVAAKTAYIEPGFALGERILRVLQCPLQRRTA